MKKLHLAPWILAVMLGSQGAHARNFYTQRPHISHIEVVDSETSPDVIGERLLYSLFDFVLELRSFYADKQRVWLGRDGELGYDIDWLLWQQSGADPATQPLLINVSRKSSHSPLLLSYLQSHGFNKESAPHRIFVDTGYEGSVIDAINTRFVANDLPEVAAHLISSIHPKSPSSRLATRAYLPEAVRHKTRFEKEWFLDVVEMQVEEIEGVPHFTDTCTEYADLPGQAGVVDALSAPQDPAEVERSRGSQRQVRRFFANNKDYVAKTLLQSATLGQFIAEMRAKAPSAEKVEELYKYTKRHALRLWWLDLREAYAKGVLKLPAESVRALWANIPKGIPSFFDLAPDQERHVLQQEQLALVKEPLPQVGRRTLVEDIVAFHAAAKASQFNPDRQQAFTDLKGTLKAGTLVIEDRPHKISEEKVGEGARGDVYSLGEEFVLKVPFELDAMRYMEVEIMVQQDLEKNVETYQIKTLPILAQGKHGQYIVRRKLPSEFLGENIAKGVLSSLQMTKLEALYEHTVAYARATGVGLDIKYDNLAWLDNDWVLFDTGPRTSYGPYAFSLDIPDFQTFYRLWKTDEPRRNGLSIATVVADIERRGGASGCGHVF